MSNINPLHAALGLNKAESDPNKVPDGTYDGKVYSDTLVYVESKDEISHVFNYEVVSQDQWNGKRKDEWFLVGKEPRIDDGEGNLVPPKKGALKVEDLKSVTPSMSEQQQTFYKRRLMSLGNSEEDVDNSLVAFGQHVGRPITFTVKTNTKGYQNVNALSLRGGDADSTPTPLSFGD